MNILDAGANEGVYTLFFASKVGSTGRVIAVEPSSRELKRLRANIAANNLNNVVVVASALADRTGEASLTIAEATHAGQKTMGTFVHSRVVSVDTEVVPTVTLDELVVAQGGPRLDLIKRDVEGAEMRALMGAENVLRTAKPLVLLELSPTALLSQGGSVVALKALFDWADYKLLCFNPDTGLPAPLRDGSLSDNVLAVHRERDRGLPID